jgi:hypothetical protein
MQNSVIILLIKSKFQKLLQKIMKKALQQNLISSTTLEDFILECTEYAVEKLSDELNCHYPTIEENKDYLAHLRDIYLPFCKRVRFRIPFREFLAFVEYASRAMVEDFTQCCCSEHDFEGYWDTWVLCRDEFYFTYLLRPYYELQLIENNSPSDQEGLGDKPF